MAGRMIGRRQAALGAALALLLAAPATAPAAAPKKRRVETVVHSHAPDAKQVKESYVHLYAPLPSGDGARPPACGWIGYLRFRRAPGPKVAKNTDPAFVPIPGILARAPMLDQL